MILRSPQKIHPHRHEWPFAALMALQFFFIIGVFWILKPLKKAFFIEFYDHQPTEIFGFRFNAAQTELLAKNLNMGLAFLAMVLLVLLARRFKKQHLITAISAILISGALVLSTLPTSGSVFAWAFYAFGDVFNMLMLAAFFAFLNDSISREQVRRILSTVVFGGVLGGAIGATLTRSLLAYLSVSQWLLACSGIITIIAFLAHAAAGHLRKMTANMTANVAINLKVNEGESTAQTSGSVDAGKTLKSLIRSKYVMSIAIIAGSYEIVSALADFQFTSAVSHYLNGDDIGRFFSTVYMTVNVVSLSVQLLLTGFVMTRFGITRTLMVLPAALLCGSIAFLIAPILLIGALLCILDNGLNYSMNQSARESLYVLIRSEAKYKAKAWVDIFIHRTAKAVSVNLTLLLSALLSFRWLALVSMGLIMIWIAAARYAGKQFDSNESANSQWPRKERKRKILKKPRLFPIVPL